MTISRNTVVLHNLNFGNFLLGYTFFFLRCPDAVGIEFVRCACRGDEGSQEKPTEGPIVINLILKSRLMIDDSAFFHLRAAVVERTARSQKTSE